MKYFITVYGTLLYFVYIQILCLFHLLVISCFDKVHGIKRTSMGSSCYGLSVYISIFYLIAVAFNAYLSTHLTYNIVISH
jgi:hypothetical protein